MCQKLREQQFYFLLFVKWQIFILTYYQYFSLGKFLLFFKFAHYHSSFWILPVNVNTYRSSSYENALRFEADCFGFKSFNLSPWSWNSFVCMWLELNSKHIFKILQFHFAIWRLNLVYMQRNVGSFANPIQTCVWSVRVCLLCCRLKSMILYTVLWVQSVARTGVIQILPVFP